VVFVLLRYSTNPVTPPENAKFSDLPERWSINSIFTPLLRKDNSLILLARI